MSLELFIESHATNDPSQFYVTKGDPIRFVLFFKLAADSSRRKSPIAPLDQPNLRRAQIKHLDIRFKLEKSGFSPSPWKSLEKKEIETLLRQDFLEVKRDILPDLSGTYTLDASVLYRGGENTTLARKKITLHAFLVHGEKDQSRKIWGAVQAAAGVGGP